MLVSYESQSAITIEALQATTVLLEDHITSRVIQPKVLLVNWQLDPDKSTVQFAYSLSQVIFLGSEGTEEQRGTSTVVIATGSHITPQNFAVPALNTFYLSKEGLISHRLTLTNESALYPVIVQIIVQGLYDDTLMVL